jgi:hypothetical protein
MRNTTTTRILAMLPILTQQQAQAWSQLRTRLSALNSMPPFTSAKVVPMGALVTNAKVYVMAEKYDIPMVKLLAKQKRVVCCKSEDLV